MTKDSPLAAFRKGYGLSRVELASLAQPEDAKLRTQISQAIARCEAALAMTDYWCLKYLWLQLEQQGLKQLEGQQAVWVRAKIAERQNG